MVFCCYSSNLVYFTVLDPISILPSKSQHKYWIVHLTGRTVPTSVLFMIKQAQERDKHINLQLNSYSGRIFVAHKFIVNKYKVSVSHAPKQVMLQFWIYIPDLGLQMLLYSTLFNSMGLTCKVWQSKIRTNVQCLQA